MTDILLNFQIILMLGVFAVVIVHYYRAPPEKTKGNKKKFETGEATQLDLMSDLQIAQEIKCGNMGIALGHLDAKISLDKKHNAKSPLGVCPSSRGNTLFCDNSDSSNSEDEQSETEEEIPKKTFARAQEGTRNFAAKVWSHLTPTALARVRNCRAEGSAIEKNMDTRDHDLLTTEPDADKETNDTGLDLLKGDAASPANNTPFQALKRVEQKARTTPDKISHDKPILPTRFQLQGANTSIMLSEKQTAKNKKPRSVYNRKKTTSQGNIAGDVPMVKAPDCKNKNEKPPKVSYAAMGKIAAEVKSLGKSVMTITLEASLMFGSVLLLIPAAPLALKKIWEKDKRKKAERLAEAEKTEQARGELVAAIKAGKALPYFYSESGDHPNLLNAKLSTFLLDAPSEAINGLRAILTNLGPHEKEISYSYKKIMRELPGALKTAKESQTSDENKRRALCNLLEYMHGVETSWKGSDLAKKKAIDALYAFYNKKTGIDWKIPTKDTTDDDEFYEQDHNIYNKLDVQRFWRYQYYATAESNPTINTAPTIHVSQSSAPGNILIDPRITHQRSRETPLEKARFDSNYNLALEAMGVEERQTIPARYQEPLDYYEEQRQSAIENMEPDHDRADERSLGYPSHHQGHQGYDTPEGDSNINKEISDAEPTNLQEATASPANNNACQAPNRVI